KLQGFDVIVPGKANMDFSGDVHLLVVNVDPILADNGRD
ncbi:hypothetical protein Tco_0868397, partial [Tanacetum coccineum]